MVVAGANVHDTKLLRPTLESIVVERPEGVQNLCLDKGYDNPTGPSPKPDTSRGFGVLAMRNWTNRAISTSPVPVPVATVSGG